MTATGSSAAPPTAGRPRKKADQERLRRLHLEALHGALARKQCENCAVIGNWEINTTKGRVTYVTCASCQRPDKVVVDVNAEQTAQQAH